jgi:hypothetical protein
LEQNGLKRKKCGTFETPFGNCQKRTLNQKEDRMKMDEYNDLTETVSDMLSEKIFETEKQLASRALAVDEDISDILREVGRKTTKKVLEKTRDEIVEKKSPKD